MSAPLVLVIEDEKAVRDSVSRVLAAEGISVAFAEDAAAALRHPAWSTCRAVLCDLKLPDGSGLDLMRVLRAQRPEVPFVMTTGFATTDTLGDALGAGARDILLKPFDAAELAEVVSRALSAAPPVQEDKP